MAKTHFFQTFNEIYILAMIQSEGETLYGSPKEECYEEKYNAVCVCVCIHLAVKLYT